KIVAQMAGTSVSAVGDAAASSPLTQYGLELSPGTVSLMVAPGGRSFTSPQIPVASPDGYATSANLSCDGLPAGLHCQFSPTTVVIKPNTKAKSDSTPTAITTVVV